MRTIEDSLLDLAMLLDERPEGVRHFDRALTRRTDELAALAEASGDPWVFGR